MGFKTSDNREVGTHVFDDYPTYDEWIGWFEMDKPADMGALAKYHFSTPSRMGKRQRLFQRRQSWKNEKDNLVDDQNQVSVELVEEDGKYYLKTNVYDVMKAFKVGLIDSDLLGCAFEPEQRFEIRTAPPSCSIRIIWENTGALHPFPGLLHLRKRLLSFSGKTEDK